VSGTGVHAVMGIGGAPEGVLTAAAMRCLNGSIQGRLVLTRPSDADRMKKMGIADVDRVYQTDDLAPGHDIILAAAGVTRGALLQGVRFFGDGIRAHCLVMTTRPRQVRFIDTIHVEEDAAAVVRF
jgi:fructose-1,6-bisphosphatase II